MASLRSILESKIGKEAEAQAAKQAIDVKVATSQADWMRERADIFAESVRANANLVRVESTNSTFSEVMEARAYATEVSENLKKFDTLYAERFPQA